MLFVYLLVVKTFLLPSRYIWLIIICCRWWVHWQLFVPSTVQMQQLFLQRLVHLRKYCKQLLRLLDSALVWAPRRLTDCTRFCINRFLENRLWKASQSPRSSIEEAPLSFGCCSQQSRRFVQWLIQGTAACVVLNRGEPAVHLMGLTRETKVQ